MKNHPFSVNKECILKNKKKMDNYSDFRIGHIHPIEVSLYHRSLTKLALTVKNIPNTLRAIR